MSIRLRPHVVDEVSKLDLRKRTVYWRTVYWDMLLYDYRGEGLKKDFGVLRFGVAKPITSLIWCGQKLSQDALLELTMAVTLDVT